MGGIVLTIPADLILEPVMPVLLPVGDLVAQVVLVSSWAIPVPCPLGTHFLP